MCEVPRIAKFVESESTLVGFTGGSVVKNQPANAGDTGSIPVQEDRPCRRATKLVLNY